MHVGSRKLFILSYFPTEVINLSLKFDYQDTANDYALLLIPFIVLYGNKFVHEQWYNETLFLTHNLTSHASCTAAAIWGQIFIQMNCFVNMLET